MVDLLLSFCHGQMHEMKNNLLFKVKQYTVIWFVF